MKRRDFLKITCFSVAGLPSRPILGFLSGKAFAKVPKAGLRKWAMVVDLNACSSPLFPGPEGKRTKSRHKGGCTDCIDACHRIHNVPDLGAKKDEIKWIWTKPYGDVFPEQVHQFAREGLVSQPVLVLCNHCENPPCVPVCPTKATFQREDGIVMMDYHRCIGCRYCMAACPYGARSFNWRNPRPFIRGVVEKCSFCEERLVKGLMPACVEACKDRGLVFGDLNTPDSEVRKVLASRYSIRRKPHLGTEPKVFYVL